MLWVCMVRADPGLRIEGSSVVQCFGANLFRQPVVPIFAFSKRGDPLNCRGAGAGGEGLLRREHSAFSRVRSCRTGLYLLSAFCKDRSIWGFARASLYQFSADFCLTGRGLLTLVGVIEPQVCGHLRKGSSLRLLKEAIWNPPAY